MTIEVIKDGQVVARGNDLSVVRRYFMRHGMERVIIQRDDKDKGEVEFEFGDGATARTHYDDYRGMHHWLARYRGLAEVQENPIGLSPFETGALWIGGGLLVGGLIYWLTRPAAASSSSQGGAPLLQNTGYGPSHVGAVAALGIQQGKSYAFQFRSIPYNDPSVGNYKDTFANVLENLGWGLHTFQGQPAISNDVVDNHLTDPSMYTAIATWLNTSGGLYNSLDHPSVTYVTIKPFGSA